ncbi:MAG TPA: mannonate dehydratase [Bacillales bacterium]|nr:mannonate dehydratase [Bacillales bacterium]
MNLSFRWFGEQDKVELASIRQIPGMKGIVSAIYDVPHGEVWPMENILQLKNRIESTGLALMVIESVPVHEDIKLGKPERQRWIKNYKQTIRNLGKAGVRTICYNFMPVFDWTRSKLDFEMPDGSTALIYEDAEIKKMDTSSGDLSLPGWDTSYEKYELRDLMAQYKQISDEDLWSNLGYFLKEVIPVAEEAGVEMAIHPDDPPWSIFGLPRIITGRKSLERLIGIYDSPSNGITFCTGSLGADTQNKLPEMIRYFGQKERIHFVHVRNLRRIAEKSFVETAHLSEEGSIDVFQIMKALDDIGFSGPLRPDHGRMIWNEDGRPGYGLFDRALGAVYLNGIWEAIQKEKSG